MLDRAFDTFARTYDRPTLIIVDSHIGYGAPTKQDTHAAHGEPLGEEEIRQTKRFYGWPEDAKFLVPDGVREHFAEGIGARGARLRAEWCTRFEAYAKAYPAEASAVDRMQRRQLPDGWDTKLPTFPADAKGLAGRDASAQGAQRRGHEYSVVDRRLRRPHALDQDAAHVRRRRRLAGGQVRRTQPPFRDSRACDGRRAQRAVALESSTATDRDFSSSATTAAVAAAGRDHGDSGHLRLHARFDRRGRGWTDASAGRAAAVVAGDSRSDHDSPGRRQRGDRSLARHPAAPPSAGGARPHSTGAANARSNEVRARQRESRAAPTSWPIRSVVRPR